MTKDILDRASDKTVSTAGKLLLGFAIIIGFPVVFILGFVLDMAQYGKGGVGLRSIPIFMLMLPSLYVIVVVALLVSSRKRKKQIYRDQVRSEVLTEIDQQPSSLQEKLLLTINQAPGLTLEEVLAKTGISKEDALPAITELLNQRQIIQKFVDGKTIIEPTNQS